MLPEWRTRLCKTAKQDHLSRYDVPQYSCADPTRRRPKRRISICQSTVLTPATIVERMQEKEALMPLPKAIESLADDATLHNPLQRMERLGTGWFGVIMEYEGVLVSDSSDIHIQAWLQVADEFKYERPLGQVFRRIRGMRNETVVMRAFNWTQNPAVARDIAKKKEEIFDRLSNNSLPQEMPGGRYFLETLKIFNIPVALACALPEARVQDGLKRYSLQDFFDAVVTAEDNGSPELEYYYMFAAQEINRPFFRCIVVGESNNSVEAAHELGMKCIIVTGGKPAYNFVGADLVVRNLNQLSFMNMKKLFSNEDLVESRLEPAPQKLFDSDM